ncbi:MAG: FAD-dependent oxidoreductase, partial [Spirochaetota bacterium]
MKTIRIMLESRNLSGVEISERKKSIVLSGRVKSWPDKITAGYTAAGWGYKGVVNDIEVENIPADVMPLPRIKDSKLEGKHFNAVIIGGGIVGTAIARELTHYDITIALLEKEEDVAVHSSSRNDGMVHPGFAPKPGTKKAFYNIRGHRAYTQICKDLDLAFHRCGSLILFRTPYTKMFLPFLIKRARKNSVNGFEYLDREKVFLKEPYITPWQHGAFFLPSAGIISPQKTTVAFAENAVENGAEVYLNTAVSGFKLEHNHITAITTNRGNVKTDVVINAAGAWSDTIAEFAQDRFFSIHPRKGVEAVLDRKTGKYQATIAAMPSLAQIKSKTKGGGLVPTVEGNLLIGPTAEEIPYREDYSTEEKDIDKLMQHLALNTRLKRSDIITYFAGIRACTYEEDFIVEASESV